MKRCIAGTLLLLAGFAGAVESSQRVKRPAPPSKIGTETQEQFNARVKWFVNDRFGMFIHFGLYSLPAWHEWVKTRLTVRADDTGAVTFRGFKGRYRLTSNGKSVTKFADVR